MSNYEVLLENASLSKKVDEILRAKGRRVVIVAYVGIGAETYFDDNFENVEIYCAREPGSTHPETIDKLRRKENCTVYFVDGLHMKIYYHEDKGVVIGSANFTNNGLNGGLKEAGVFIKNTKDIKIDRLIESLNANEVNDESLRQLYEGRDNLAASIPKRKGNNNTISHSFMGWYNSGGMRVRSWKAAWYEGNDNNNRRDDVGRQLRNWTYIADKNHLEVSNWVLTFNLGRNPGRFPVKWLFVQSIFKDDLNVENDYPFVAGQHNELGKIASNPPFELDNNFNRALREVVRAQDIGVLVNEDLTPRDELINNLWAALCVN